MKLFFLVAELTKTLDKRCWKADGVARR